MPERSGSRLRRAWSWIKPSVAAAAFATLAGSLTDATSAGSWSRGLGAAAFVTILVFPITLVASLGVRGLWKAWRVSDLSVIDATGAAPRLAGWFAAILVCAACFAAALWISVTTIADQTDFTPIKVSVLLPMLGLVPWLAVLLLSRPAARVFSRGFDAIERRWQRSGRKPLLRPRTIALMYTGLLVASGYAIWRLVVSPRLDTFDTSLFVIPCVVIAVLLIAHGLRNALFARVGLACAAICVAMCVAGFVLRKTNPEVLLEVWGDHAIAGSSVDLLYNLDSIRNDLPIETFKPAEIPNASHHDIVLITIDTVRADHTPPYGGAAKMPNLASLAERGAVFTWAFAPSNVTRRSIPTMITGLEPHRVRGRVVGWALRLDPRHVVLAERMRAGGYATAGFMCCEGFWGPEVRTGWQRGLDHIQLDRSGNALAESAAAWIRERKAANPRQPLFVWLHFIEPHNWLGGSPEPRTPDERTRLYDKSLTSADSMIGTVMAGYPDPTTPIVVVTADHGEGLGDHGQPWHSTDLYNSQIRVPLVIAGPGIERRAVPESVGLVDLVPTIIELAGFQPPELDGRSLAGVLLGRRASRSDSGTAFSAMIKDRSNPGGVSAVVRGRWKLIADDDDGEELYDVYTDPDEKTNLASQRPEILILLRALLAEKLAAGRESAL